MGSIIVALMVSGWFEMSLIARAEELKVKELEYIQAARAMILLMVGCHLVAEGIKKATE